MTNHIKSLIRPARTTTTFFDHAAAGDLAPASDLEDYRMRLVARDLQDQA